MSDVLNLKYSELLKKNDNYITYRKEFKKIKNEKELTLFLEWCKKYKIKNWYRGITNIETLRKIKELRIDTDETVDYLPDSIGSLENLEELYIPYNIQIEELPESIGKLINLIELEVNSSKLKSLPESIKDLKKLKELHIHSYRLSYIPNNIGELTNLKKLYIYSSDLKKIPESIDKLENLEDVVFLWSMKVPPSFGNLTKIKELTINPIILEENPKLLDNFSFLAKLSLVDESLKKVPKVLFDLKAPVDISWTFNGLNAIESIKLRTLQLFHFSKMVKDNIEKK